MRWETESDGGRKEREKCGKKGSRCRTTWRENVLKRTLEVIQSTTINQTGVDGAKREKGDLRETDKRIDITDHAITAVFKSSRQQLKILRTGRSMCQASAGIMKTPWHGATHLLARARPAIVKRNKDARNGAGDKSEGKNGEQREQAYVMAKEVVAGKTSLNWESDRRAC
jgi:hypothetical protein